MGWVTGILLWPGVVLIAAKLYSKLIVGWCRSNVCLVGKTVIVTEANTGIGYETAEDLAKRGAKVIMACRDQTKGQHATESIIKATSNKNVIFKQLDLASFRSIRAFAGDINNTEERLNILINNAEAVGFGRTQSEDGLLLQMQTNFFGPFLLTNLLLDLLKKTPNSRIVNVSSAMAKFVKSFDVNELNSYPEEKLNPNLAVYCKSKLCNILFTIELADRLRGSSATCYSVHSGIIPTDINKRLPAWLQFLVNKAFVWIMKNRVEGAQTTIYCSVAKGIESRSGEHFANCRMVSRYNTAKDPDLPKKLWRASEELIIKVKTC